MHRVYSRSADARGKEYFERLEKFIETSNGTLVEKLYNFPKYTPATSLVRFISKYELFKQIVDVPGSIIECGVWMGAGLMAWAQLAQILDPNYVFRTVIGFDTFERFPARAPEDGVPSGSERQEKIVADFEAAVTERDSFEDVKQAVDLFTFARRSDMLNPEQPRQRVDLVRGNSVHTIPEYIEKNPHLVVALLYLDFDLFEGTQAAIRGFLPRMPKGSIIVFDELHAKHFPGETQAVMTEIGIPNLRIKRFPFDVMVSYAVLE